MDRFTAEQFADFARVAHDPDCGSKVAALLNGEADPEDFEAVADNFRQYFNPMRGNDAVLYAADVLLEGYGVEHIRGEDGHAVASYVNTGDTYATTLLLDLTEDSFLVTSYGDWVEAYEQEYGCLP